MTEAEKDRQLRNILDRAYFAERKGLYHTAKSWRDHAATLAAIPADEIVFAQKPADAVANR